MSKLRNLLSWLNDQRPSVKRADAMWNHGYQSALRNLEDARVVWDKNVGGVYDQDRLGFFDKPATIKAWKEAHMVHWERSATFKDYTHLDRATNTRRSQQENPDHIAEHERYLEVFPDLREENK